LTPTLAAARDHVEVDYGMNTIDDTSFFEITNVHPEKRTHVPLHHIDYFTDVVHVTRRVPRKVHKRKREVSLLSQKGQQETLHLRVLVQTMHTSLPSLYRWHVEKHGATRTFRQLPQAILDQPVVPSLVPPIASEILAQIEDDARPAAPPTGGGVLVLNPPDEAAAVTLLESLRRIQQGPSDEVDVLSIPVLEMSQVQALAATGAIVLQESEFGGLTLRVDPTQTMYISMQVVNTPTQVMFSHDRFVVASKLDIVMSLLLKSWTPGVGVPEPYQSHSPKTFICDLHKAASYFACLALAADLFGKGIAEIPHNEKDLYYQCLLRLRGSSLEEFLRMEKICLGAGRR